ncbi:MAG: 5-oxoprolinase/urea amidolyase family protein [Myxococcales bacterium]
MTGRRGQGGLQHLADGAALLQIPNADALRLAAALLERPPPGLLDAVPGACTLLVLFDPEVLAHGEVSETLARAGTARGQDRPRTVRLRASYGGADGPDLDGLARAAGVAEAELARLHASAVHTVAFLGFAPGFAYLSGAPPALAVPRLPSPRVRVPPGSLAVADGYTGIYPSATPGGWRLIGRVAQRLFDPAASPPALLRPGDRVVFEPVPADALGPLPELVAAEVPTGAPLARTIAPGPFTTVQGGPRYGLSSSGVPTGGAVDLAALAAANARVGNAAAAAGLEATLAGPELELLVASRIAVAGGAADLALQGRAVDGPGPHAIAAGERLKLSALRSGVRAYLAFAGGLAQPRPGETVRGLSRGETLYAATATATAAGPARAGAVASQAASAPGDAAIEVRALRGPQWDFFAPAGQATFFSADYRVSPQSDRRGVRLLGPAIALARGADLPSEGTAPGAVQVPGAGLPIVLGPDRPVTGGYPKIATVISADLALFAQARPGTRVRFREATLAEALAARRSHR